MEEIEPGALYLVATPIGHLGDITYRAVEILKRVDLIAAEDTRKTGVLLRYYDIKRPTTSYHSYNVKTQTGRLVEKLKQGYTIALVSDAGTPGISDPGYHLVKACIEQGVKVIPVPGATALVSALIVSGLPTQRFVYEGFLPSKKGRKTRFEQLAREPRTIVLYESPHRILKTLTEILKYWGDRRCVMAREITKKFEEIFRGNVSQLLEHLQQKTVKGEIVLVVEGFSNKREKEDG